MSKTLVVTPRNKQAIMIKKKFSTQYPKGTQEPYKDFAINRIDIEATEYFLKSKRFQR